MSDWGVKFTWTVRLADRSDSQMLCERGKHDSQLATKGRGGPRMYRLKPRPLSIPTIPNFFDFSLHFSTTKFYPSHRKKKMSSKTDYFRYTKFASFERTQNSLALLLGL